MLSLNPKLKYKKVRELRQNYIFTKVVDFCNMAAATTTYTVCYLAVISFLVLSYITISLKSLSHTRTHSHVVKFLSSYMNLCVTEMSVRLGVFKSNGSPLPTFRKGHGETRAPGQQRRATEESNLPGNSK